MRARDLAQIQIRRDDVAKHETLEPELVLAVHLGDEARGFERGQQAKCRRPRNPGPRRQLAERQPPLVKGKGAEQLERLGRRIDGIPPRPRERFVRAFHWMKPNIAQ